METLDINVKTWRDKMYGNTYFAGTITTDFATSKERVFLLPFEYGYGEFCLQRAKKLLTEFNLISPQYMENLRNYCKNNDITLRFYMQENCKKSDLKNIVTNYNNQFN
jgi:hypothetical protein